MNFGILYEDNLWHVIRAHPAYGFGVSTDLVSDCSGLFISTVSIRGNVYPVKHHENTIYSRFSYKSLCKECIKKHNLTKANIDQHIINTKLGVKIPD